MCSSQRWAFRCLSFFAVLFQLTGAPAQDGGIEVFSGHTIFESGSRISISHLYSTRDTLFSGSEEVANLDKRSMLEHRMVLGFNHGLTSELALTFLLPVVEKEWSSPAGDFQARGLADAALLAKYRFYSEYWSQSAFHVSAIGGLELPTGSTKENDGQLGSGSVDVIAGLGLTLSVGRFRFDTHAIYKANNEGSRDYSEGDFLTIGSTFAYRFYHAKYPGPSASVKVGLNWRHENSDELSGAPIHNTGLGELRLRAGLVYHPYPEIDLVALVEVPVYGDYKASGSTPGQLALDVRTFFGFGFRF